MTKAKKPAKASKTSRPDRSPKTTDSNKTTVPARIKDGKAPAEDLSGLNPKKEARVEIKPAKGRPMLTWVGKKPLRHAIAYPAQLVETFHAAPLSKSSSRAERSRSDSGGAVEAGLLFHGDNKDVLAYLLANGFRGKVKLIYIDPPFDSGADYVKSRVTRQTAASLKWRYTLGEQVNILHLDK
jgi:hypothetical protein